MTLEAKDRPGVGWITRGLKPGRWIHRIWWHFSDYGQMRLWRPVCWIRGYHVPHHCDVHFENCYLCWKPLWSRRRDGHANPYRIPDVSDRAPLTKRGRRAYLHRRVLEHFDSRSAARAAVADDLSVDAAQWNNPWRQYEEDPHLVRTRLRLAPRLRH